MLLEVLDDGSGLELLLSKYDPEIVNIRKLGANNWVFVVLL